VGVQGGTPPAYEAEVVSIGLRARQRLGGARKPPRKAGFPPQRGGGEKPPPLPQLGFTALRRSAPEAHQRPAEAGGLGGLGVKGGAQAHEGRKRTARLNDPSVGG
jgi:hypothetical protein